MVPPQSQQQTTSQPVVTALPVIPPIPSIDVPPQMQQQQQPNQVIPQSSIGLSQPLLPATASETSCDLSLMSGYVSNNVTLESSSNLQQPSKEPGFNKVE